MILSPAIGGIIFGYEIARQLGIPRAIFAERINGKMEIRVIRRGFSILENERVLLVDDVVSHGETCKELIRLVRKFKAQIVGLACIVDRGNSSFLNIPIHSLVKTAFPVYAPDQCPMCQNRIELVSPTKPRLI